MYKEELKWLKDIAEDLEAKRDEVFHLECTMSTVLQKMDKELNIITRATPDRSKYNEQV